jgi:predicted GNAT family acetyltransferase
MAIEVRDVPDEGHFVITVDGTQAGVAEYKLRDDLMVFTHTEIDSDFEGRGLASTLVRAALDVARARGLQVQPLCPYVRSWIRKHPDYQDLVLKD